MKGKERKTGLCCSFFFVCLFSLRRGRCGRNEQKEHRDGEKMRVGDEAAGIRYIISFGGAVFYGAERRAINC